MDKPDPALTNHPAIIPGTVVARDILHVAPRTLRRWVRAGKVKAMRTSKHGGKFLFRREEIARLLRQLEDDAM